MQSVALCSCQRFKGYLFSLDLTLNRINSKAHNKWLWIKELSHMENWEMRWLKLNRCCESKEGGIWATCLHARHNAHRLKWPGYDISSVAPKKFCSTKLKMGRASEEWWTQKTRVSGGQIKREYETKDEKNTVLTIRVALMLSAQ